MVMTEACHHVADVHPSALSSSKGRMPVILAHPDWSDWLGVADGAQRHRAPDAAGLLCRPYRS
ncbi:MAG: putative response-associated peptidase [Novosphingobium sp.]|nr:putative response-associated peptidase [Novosphingobium sp.]